MTRWLVAQHLPYHQPVAENAGATVGNSDRPAGQPEKSAVLAKTATISRSSILRLTGCHTLWATRDCPTARHLLRLCRVTT